MSYNPSNYDLPRNDKDQGLKRTPKVEKKIESNEAVIPSHKPNNEAANADFEVLDTVESRMDISHGKLSSDEEEKDNEVSYDLERDEFDN